MDERMSMESTVRSFRDLRVYQQGQDTAYKIFLQSKRWPVDERYSLIDQIRRSSRSICGNIAEAWAKRRYVAHFVSKLSDADAEACESRAWLDSALRCEYMSERTYAQLDAELAMISGGLVKMMSHPEKWCGPSGMVREEPAEYDVSPGAPSCIPSSIPSVLHSRGSMLDQRRTNTP